MEPLEQKYVIFVQVVGFNLISENVCLDFDTNEGINYLRRHFGKIIKSYWWALWTSNVELTIDRWRVYATADPVIIGQNKWRFAYPAK